MINESSAIRATFKPFLLEEGEKVNNEKCPLCSGWVCGFPTYQKRIIKGIRYWISIWECWSCKTEIVQTEILGPVKEDK